MLGLLVPAMLLLSAPAAVAGERTVALTVENMTCALCPATVRTAIARVAGVKDVQVDFESKTATVVFDDDMATVEDITEASRLAGYPASPKQ